MCSSTFETAAASMSGPMVTPGARPSPTVSFCTASATMVEKRS